MKSNISSAREWPALVVLSDELERCCVDLGIKRDEQFVSRVAFVALFSAVILATTKPENAGRLSTEIADALLTDPDSLTLSALVISLKCKNEDLSLSELREMLDSVWLDLDSASAIRVAGPPGSSRIILCFGLGLALAKSAPAAAHFIIGHLKKADKPGVELAMPCH
jgi:hypothetical protein